MDEEKLFLNGIKAFNRKKYYEAHEHWEEIWTELNVDDSIFIQGLIQLSVGFFHITNSNIKGAKSLFRKSMNKLIQYKPLHRNINVDELIECASKAINDLETSNSTRNFDWKLAPMLKYKKYD